MNGIHDMGGMQCYGPVKPETNEPLFHAEWEKDAMALTVAMGFTGMWNLDASRFARESLAPRQYLNSSYYQIWIAALQNLMVERGMVQPDELASGEMITPAFPTKRPVPGGATMPAALAKGGPVAREPDRKPLFAVGEKVRTVKINPAHHTRLPAYARDAVGTVEAVAGFHVFPDDNARGLGENPQWLYTITFEARVLFGPEAEEKHRVHLDLFEPYLKREAA